MRYATERADIIDEVSLLQRFIARALRRSQDQHPDCAIVRHVDLVSDQQTQFGQPYERFGLSETAGSTNGVRSLSHPGVRRVLLYQVRAELRALANLRREGTIAVREWPAMLTLQNARVQAAAEENAVPFDGRAAW